MAVLHLTGTPLAATQADLTPVQTAFLAAALPDALALLHGRRRGRGSGLGGTQHAGGHSGGIDPRLRQEAQRRQVGR